jgi:hypothetical protein
MRFRSVRHSGFFRAWARICRWCGATLVLAAVLAAIDPALAQKPAAKPRTAYEDSLDSLLEQRRFSELFNAVNARDPDTMDRALSWLRIEFLERGQGTEIGYMYTAQLNRAASTLPGLMGAAFRQAGLTMMQMTRWIVLTEGFQCADNTSVANRLKLLNNGFAALDQELKGLDLVHRREILTSAYERLQTHFSRRMDDEWLCNGGDEYNAAYTKKHGAPPGPNAPYDAEIRPRILPAPQGKLQRESALAEIVRSTRNDTQIELH